MRSSRESEPWWARAISRPSRRSRASCARELVEPQRQPLGERRLLTKTIVERCASTSASSSRVDRRPDRAGRARRRRRLERSAPASSGSAARCVRLDASSRPGRDLEVELLARAGVDDRATRAAGPTRKRPTSSSGRCVAESPMRCSRRRASASRRSSESARWAPRLVAATAWISSTITVSTPPSISRAREVSSR